MHQLNHQIANHSIEMQALETNKHVQTPHAHIKFMLLTLLMGYDKNQKTLQGVGVV